MKSINVRSSKGKHVQLHDLESQFDLSFSSYLVLSNKIIALDEIKNRLLVWQANKDVNQSSIIELNKVAAVSLKKSYGSIRPEDMYTSGSEDFVKTIDLK